MFFPLQFGLRVYARGQGFYTRPDGLNVSGDCLHQLGISVAVEG